MTKPGKATLGNILTLLFSGIYSVCVSIYTAVSVMVNLSFLECRWK